jgi:hypothetical protein
LNHLPLRTILLDRLGRLLPRFFWSWYSIQARRQGFDRLYLVLSFDCDTRQDIEASEGLHVWLAEHNIKTTFAVPGAQLDEGAMVYRSLAKMGADFINHGAKSHTLWKEDHYESSAFYDLMSPQEVIDDIRKGHDIVTRVIGKAPRGFRGPHFGKFQEKWQLDLIYSTIKPLGYKFSTTTVPGYAFAHGPADHSSGIYEFPLSGSAMAPISILDSYSYIIGPRDRFVTDDYGLALMRTVERLISWKVCGLLNIYVDPSHVSKNDLFFDAMDYIVEQGIPSLQYPDIIASLGRMS